MQYAPCDSITFSVHYLDTKIWNMVLLLSWFALTEKHLSSCSWPYRFRFYLILCSYSYYYCHTDLVNLNIKHKFFLSRQILLYFAFTRYSIAILTNIIPTFLFCSFFFVSSVLIHSTPYSPASQSSCCGQPNFLFWTSSIFSDTHAQQGATTDSDRYTRSTLSSTSTRSRNVHPVRRNVRADSPTIF